MSSNILMDFNLRFNPQFNLRFSLQFNPQISEQRPVAILGSPRFTG
jgi:hypothetical protein